MPAIAQYTDSLGGNWNNPASAMITNMIMDRYARRRLEKSYADKRANSGSKSGASPASASAPKVDEAAVRFRSTGTQLKAREIANLISPGNQPSIYTLDHYSPGIRQTSAENEQA